MRAPGRPSRGLLAPDSPTSVVYLLHTHGLATVAAQTPVFKCRASSTGSFTDILFYSVSQKRPQLLIISVKNQPLLMMKATQWAYKVA